MNPVTEQEAVLLAHAQDNKNVVICPPFVFLEAIIKEVRHAQIGAQDVSHEELGSFTGEVAARQLKDIGARYVIIGHSERRIYQGDTDELVAKKIRQSIRAGLIPIVCVGENAQERAKGEERKVVDKQLVAALQALDGYTGKCLFAYEPVWSISTFAKGGALITPSEAHDMLFYIQQHVGILSGNVKLLYGGSVNETNVKEFISPDYVSGVLIGSASLSVQSITRIINIIN